MKNQIQKVNKVQKPTICAICKHLINRHEFAIVKSYSIKDPQNIENRIGKLKNPKPGVYIKEIYIHKDYQKCHTLKQNADEKKHFI